MKPLIDRLTQRLLRGAITIAPAAKSEWIRAMIAEMSAIETPWQSLQWAFGALSFACRCRILAELGILQENVGMNRASITRIVVLVVVVCALFTIPSFRQALTVIPATVNIALGNNALNDADLRRIATEAEQHRDARSMAFAAMHLKDSSEAMQLGNRAIAIDPALCWIKYFIIRNDWAPDLRRTTFAPDIQQVIAADPGNALGHLLQAEWIGRRDHLQDEWMHPSTPHPRGLHPEWKAAMDSAFSSPRYDNYLNRKLELEHEFARAHSLPPFAAALSTLGAAVPDMSSINSYGNQLIASGNTPACARAFHFGGMLQSGQTSLESAIGQNLSARALTVLDKKFELPLSAPRSTGPTFSDMQTFSLTNAIIVQVSLLIAILAITLVTISSAALPFLRSKSATLPSLIRRCTATAIASLFAALVAYIPFAAAYTSYQRAQSARLAAEQASPFIAFYLVPSNLHLFYTSARASFCFWTLLIAIAAATMLWRIAAHLQRARTKLTI